MTWIGIRERLPKTMQKQTMLDIRYRDFCNSAFFPSHWKPFQYCWRGPGDVPRSRAVTMPRNTVFQN